VREIESERAILWRLQNLGKVRHFVWFGYREREREIHRETKRVCVYERRYIERERKCVCAREREREREREKGREKER